MIVAVVSDIHDNLWQLARVLKEIALSEAVICCGDFCAPFTLNELASRYRRPVYAVFGNNDGDRAFLSQIGSRYPQVSLLGDFGEINLDHRSVAITHYPEIGRALASSGQYDLVCSGHTHVAHREAVGETWWVNPGEVMGRFGRSGFALYDTTKDEVSLCELKSPPIDW